MSEWVVGRPHPPHPDHLEVPRGIVVVGGQIQLQRCTLYLSHYCAVLNNHHICPDSWWQAAGKDPNLSPMISLCPNCHYNIHACIDGIYRGQDISLLPLRCQAKAKEAFTIAKANGLTPAPTL